VGNNYTIKDIAKRAQVGTTTVSRVLNNHPYVSDEKRQRVLNAMDELNYRQNLGAKWLRSASTGLIGFLTDEVATTPYAVDIIRGAQDAAAENDMVIIVVSVGGDLPEIEEAIEFLLERQVMGIIYAAMYHREVHLPDNITNVPTALANCFSVDASLPSAVPDEETGAYRATKVLLEAGHTRIGFINVIPPSTPAMNGRLRGYQRALSDYGIPFDEQLIGTSDFALHNYNETQRLLNLKNPPTAFFSGTDRTAMATYAALRDAGLRVPEDISVVGFDNQIDVALNLLPNLTTVQLPHYEMGAWAVRKLLSGDNEIIQEKIDCPLVERQSVSVLDSVNIQS
ncbi:MAG: LacI family DNA-binding transcriptional regulator, partial [Chloroflexota bacterium]